MWLYTTIGFFSVVDKGDGRMTIRSRHRADLERLKCIHIPTEPGDVAGALRRVRITSTTNNDYPFRIVVSSSTFEVLIVMLVRDITYHNFKSAAGSVLGKKREKTLHDIWRAMRLGAENVDDDEER